jgi:hypothetical protein
MDYRGTIIEESLEDNSLLKDVKIISTKVESVTEKHQTPWLTKWTLHMVEIPQNKGDDLAEKISKKINKKRSRSWYVDYKNDLFHFIIYKDKIFKIDRKNPVLYKEAKQFGISLGIPEYQVDFAPDDKVWDR